MEDLPEAFRIVFITRVIEGMNVEETAEILGLKPETVKTRLHRAENRPCGDGRVSVCRRTLRTVDRRGIEATWIHRLI
jgi:hypothetical protein